MENIEIVLNPFDKQSDSRFKVFQSKKLYEFIYSEYLVK